MANKIIHKRSSVAAKVPLATDLDYGELAVNYTDVALYLKKADNSIARVNDAINIKNTPAGNVTATEIQSAINQLDSLISAAAASAGSPGKSFFMAGW